MSEEKISMFYCFSFRYTVNIIQIILKIHNGGVQYEKEGMDKTA